MERSWWKFGKLPARRPEDRRDYRGTICLVFVDTREDCNCDNGNVSSKLREETWVTGSRISDSAFRTSMVTFDILPRN